MLNFFQNKVVIIIEGIIIALGAAGLILGGTDIVDIEAVPQAALGVVTAVESIITIIQGLTKKDK